VARYSMQREAAASEFADARLTGEARSARRESMIVGCHPEVRPTPSSPGALHGWQPPDPSAAIRHYLLLHHYLRLRRLQRQEVRANGWPAPRENME
jgi:hypothetical protein